MNKNMIYFYCLACFIPSVIMLFAILFAILRNKDFDEYDLSGFLCIFFIIFILGLVISVIIYSSYFPPAPLEKLEMIMNKTND